MAALTIDKFIVNGYSFSDLPASFDAINQNSYSVRSQSYPTIDGGRKTVVLGPPKSADNSFSYLRRATSQAFRVRWEGENNGPCGPCLAMYLQTLYSLQTSFYVQFDELMSWDEFKAAIAVPHGNNYRAYFTPTWPIKPKGWTPLNGITWDHCVFVNNRPVDTSLFTVDELSGMIQFSFVLTASDVVTVLYTWRMYARIAEFNLVASGSSPAQEIFIGEVIFEQTKILDGSPDNWLGDFPCTDSAANAPSLSGSLYSAPSVPINPTEYLSYNAATVPSMPSLTDGSSGSSLPNQSNPSWPTYGTSLPSIAKDAPSLQTDPSASVP